MALSLPPDPYLALGVSKDAFLPEIRSAHRKLVLKCHPDKVQDAALKAIKQDEFQKVQQAYELLSDETRRLQYDEQVKLIELRKEMRRGVPTLKPDPFEFEIRVAEPRTTYATRSRGSPPVKIYTTQSPPKTYDSPKLYEDVYDKPLRSAKKSSSYESAERRRDEEKLREAREIRKREDEKKRAAHADRKKTRDKDKRRDVEDKRTRTTQPYFEDGSDDSDPPPPREAPREIPRERKAPRDRPRMDEIPMRAEGARTSASPRIGTAPLTPKWDGHKDSALEYMNAARSKAPADDGFRPPGLRRGETFAGPETVYTVRYASPTKAAFHSLSDDDSPRRSSFRRRASEAPSRSREPPRKESSSRRSPSTRKVYADIVDPPSPPSVPKTPKLKSHSSAPPTSEFATPARSKTEYPRKAKDAPMPSVTRSQTFQSGDRERGRDREGSKLRIPVHYESPESDSDGITYAAPRTSRSPPRPTRASRSPPRPQRASSPPRRRDGPEKTRYSVSSQGAVPITPMSRHRSELHNIDNDSYFPRERSESPRGGKSSGSRQAQRSQAHHTPTEPIVLTARPKPSRDHGSSSRGGALYGEVKFSPNYRAEDIRYSPQSSADPFRRGSDLGPRDNYPSTRSGRGEVYASG
jgi:curved DNA-binding protein CbpA